MAIGAVFRGNKELDGVLSHRGGSGLEEVISSMLLGSKHQGQVRLILLDENRLPEPVDPGEIWEKTGKPVLVISGKTEIDSRYMFEYQDRVFLAAGVDEESAKRVIKKIGGSSGFEVLRIAEIILEKTLLLHNV